MNIVSVKQLPGQQDYLLKEDDKTVLKLCYKNDLHTARVQTENERRVLTIDDEGLLKTKSVLKNEYGIRIGSLNYDNFSDTQGSVDIENIKYRFIVMKGETPELNIYKGSHRNLIYNCRVVLGDIKSRVKGSQAASLIIAISWYLFLQESVHQQHAFNEAIIL